MVEKEVTYTLTKNEVKAVIALIGVQLTLASLLKDESLSDPETVVDNVLEYLDKK